MKLVKVFLSCLQLLQPHLSLNTSFYVRHAWTQTTRFLKQNIESFSLWYILHLIDYYILWHTGNWSWQKKNYHQLLLKKESQPTWRTKATTFVSAIYVKQHTSRSTKIIRKKNKKKKCKQSNIYSAAMQHILQIKKKKKIYISFHLWIKI